jgi:hypothetical protein
MLVSNILHLFLGSVIKDFPNQKSVRKGISNPVLPDSEDAVSTKEVRAVLIVFFLSITQSVHLPPMCPAGCRCTQARLVLVLHTPRVDQINLASLFFLSRDRRFIWVTRVALIS